MPAQVAQLPFRESTQSKWLSNYRRCWQGSVWLPFLQPARGGFAAARLSQQAIAGTNTLMDQPGVYELALVKRGNDVRYKVYVGQTSSIRRRFHNEYRGSSGSHLKVFLEEALQNGCEIWRRCKYMQSAEDTRKKEAQLLKMYDYAWNSRQAGCKPRHVNLVVSQFCFSKSIRLESRPHESALALSSPLAMGLRQTSSNNSLPAEDQNRPRVTCNTGLHPLRMATFDSTLLDLHTHQPRI